MVVDDVLQCAIVDHLVSGDRPVFNCCKAVGDGLLILVDGIARGVVGNRSMSDVGVRTVSKPCALTCGISVFIGCDRSDCFTCGIGDDLEAYALGGNLLLRGALIALVFEFCNLDIKCDGYLIKIAFGGESQRGVFVKIVGPNMVDMVFCI